jgi:hypothetical protein
MMEVTVLIQPTIALPAISDDRCSRLDEVNHEGV